jgi:hypothetical protein
VPHERRVRRVAASLPAALTSWASATIRGGGIGLPALAFPGRARR